MLLWINDFRASDQPTQVTANLTVSDENVFIALFHQQNVWRQAIHELAKVWWHTRMYQFCSETKNWCATSRSWTVWSKHLPKYHKDILCTDNGTFKRNQSIHSKNKQRKKEDCWPKRWKKYLTLSVEDLSDLIGKLAWFERLIACL